jgi:signal transduction histidine kinase
MVPILSAMLPHGVALHLHLTPDLTDVAIDPVQVVRIVSNLVLNSCAALVQSATSGEGQVTLETANDSGSVVLRVRDTGPGMPASARVNLFRQCLGPDPLLESAGLGLASVRRMVRRVGGLIQIESTPGSGTEVSIRFPVPAPRSGGRSHKPSGLSRRKLAVRAHEQLSGSNIEKVRTESTNQR